MTRRTRLVGVVFIFTFAAGWNARAQPLLDRRVGVDEFGRAIVAENLDEAIGTFARAAGVPIGIEIAPGMARKTRAGTLTGLTVREALDLLASFRPGYEWREMNGAFVLRTPAAWAQRDHPLHIPVQPVVLESIRARNAFALITAFLGESPDDLPQLADTTRFSLRLEKGTVLDLLNATVAAHGSLAWIFQHKAAPGYPFLLSMVSGNSGYGSYLSGLPPEHVIDVSKFADAPLFSIGGSPAVLDRIVGNGPDAQPLVVRGASPSAVWELAKATKVPMGIEFLGPGKRPVSAEIPATGRPLRDVLDSIVTLDPRYEWREMDGVIVIRSVRSWNDRENLLFRQVPAIQLIDVLPQEAVERLARELGYMQPIPFPLGKRLSLDTAPGTILDLLNAIVRAHGELTWTLRPTEPEDVRVGYHHELEFGINGGGGLGFMIR